MSANDYAILIGIASYPKLGNGGNPLNLSGPANDVDAIAQWLRDSGQVPDDNISIVKSSDNTGMPNVDGLVQEVYRLDDLAQQNSAAGKGRQVGRRLYIYMSGHGFSPSQLEGCLYAANATTRAGNNVNATNWLSWLQDSGYFREFVLWMDCCMNRVMSFPPGDLQLVSTVSPMPAGPTFVAFAAQRPLKAVEAPIPEDNGKVHGLFTWALLEGLRGAAVDSNGRVTGRSLADWIRNAQSSLMQSADKKDPGVSVEPWIIKEDSDLIFARGIPPLNYRVELTFPATAIGKTPRLWSGIPPRSEDLPVISAQSQVLDLVPGLYLVDVPESGLRQGFEVVGPAKIAIQETGDPVIASPVGQMFDLKFDPNDPTAQIFVIDSRFSLVDRDSGQLVTKLPFGLYKVKTRIGRSLTDRVVLFDRNYIPASVVSAAPASPAMELAPSPAILSLGSEAIALSQADSILPAQDLGEIAPQPATVAPLAGTSAKHDYQQAAAEEGRKSLHALGQSGKQAGLLLMVRVWTGELGSCGGFVPWDGITIVDAKGKLTADLSKDGTRNQAVGDPYCVLTLTLKPDTYYLRQRMDQNSIVEQTLVLVEGWGLEVYVLRSPAREYAAAQAPGGNLPQTVPSEAPADEEGIPMDARPRISMMMSSLRRAEAAEYTPDDRVLETARVALVDERAILNQKLENLLLVNFQDPLAGIIGGHLLLIEHERDPHRSLAMLNTVVENLRRLVGNNHPDVEALSLRCPDETLRCRSPVTSAPLLQRSWKLLVDASYEQPKLIPKAVFDRVEASIAFPPFLAWAVDDESKTIWRKHMQEALASSPTPRSAAVDTDQQANLLSGRKGFLQAETSQKNQKQLMTERARRLGLPYGMIAQLSKSKGDNDLM